jgi:hypothetical protein
MNVTNETQAVEAATQEIVNLPCPGDAAAVQAILRKHFPALIAPADGWSIQHHSTDRHYVVWGNKYLRNDGTIGNGVGVEFYFPLPLRSRRGPGEVARGAAGAGPASAPSRRGTARL